MSQSLLLVCLSPSWGGLEIHVRDYARWLAQQSETRLSLAVREGSPLHRALADLQVPIWVSKSGPSSVPLGMSAELARFARAQGVTRIHAHDQRDLLLATLLRRRLRVPLAYTRHMGLAGPKKNPYHGWVYAAVDLYLTVSDWMAQDARRLLPLPADRIQRIWPGVSPPSDAGSARTHEGFAVGMLARILAGKGQHLLVEAAALLRAEGRALRVVLAGEVHEAQYWARVQARALEAGVNLDYLGVVSPPDRGYAQLDVVVNASQAEAFGLSTVEAMRRGLGVIGADSGATPEILRHEVDGLIFRSGDATDLAAQLRRMVDDDVLLRQLGATARQRAETCFDQRTQFEKIWAAVRGMSEQR